MSWTVDLVEGLAGVLSTSGAGVWRPDGPAYAAGETAIVIGAMPPSPDRCIAINPYPVDDHVSQTDVTVGVQVRTRGDADPRTVLDLDDAVFDALDGLHAVVLGQVEVAQINRRSSSPMGRDQADREEHSSNYYVDATRPPTARQY